MNTSFLWAREEHPYVKNLVTPKRTENVRCWAQGFWRMCSSWMLLADWRELDRSRCAGVRQALDVWRRRVSRETAAATTTTRPPGATLIHCRKTPGWVVTIVVVVIIISSSTRFSLKVHLPPFRSLCSLLSVDGKWESRVGLEKGHQTSGRFTDRRLRAAFRFPARPRRTLVRVFAPQVAQVLATGVCASVVLRWWSSQGGSTSGYCILTLCATSHMLNCHQFLHSGGTSTRIIWEITESGSRMSSNLLTGRVLSEINNSRIWF